MKRQCIKRILIICFYCTGQIIGLANPRDETPPYRDPNLSVTRRIDDLIGRMTLEEKVGQLNIPCVYKKEMGSTVAEKFEFSRAFAKGDYPDDIGPGGGFFVLADEILHEGPEQQARFNNELQKIATGQTRLGIPLLQVEEGTHGLMTPGATIFPEGLALGSTWNMDLIRDVYTASAKEARAIGAHLLFTLVIEPNRDPRLGRNQETYSEDPYLCAQIAEMIVAGAQGDNIAHPEKVIAGLCHYPGQSQAVGGLEQGAMEISERKLREVFLPPWQAGIAKSGALAVMATYPAIDGQAVHGSVKYLTKILRQEMHFQGCVFSEGGGFGHGLIGKKVVATQKQAGALALHAGVDIGITFEAAYMGDLIENVQEGRIPETLVDRALRRLLYLKFRLGLFEDPFVDPQKAKNVVHQKTHRDLALQAARESIVLLKNQNDILPLDKNTIRTIAVIGPNADNPRNQLGDYITGHVLQDIITVKDGIENLVNEDTKVKYVKGCNVLRTNFNEIDKAVDVAESADVAVVVVGENERFAPDGTGSNGEHKDVASLDLTGLQQKLVQSVYATGTPTIVVLINGRPLSTRWIAENVPAVIEAWIPGEAGGQAIAEVLFGEYNPDGRLAITIPRHVGQLPVYYNYMPSKAATMQRKGVGYVDMSIAPLFPFGFGLSYTSFEYSDLSITPSHGRTGSEFQVEIVVRNTGKRAGSEVVQLYINDVISSLTTPVRELRGFKKVHLAPGQSQSVTFKLQPKDLSFYNQYLERIVEPGTFDVMVGSSCDDIRLRGSFNIAEQ